ncbi:hypothetical protein F0562_032438 [Nyssa sinensis]|uniref:Transmembrane 9 superfamily member n=1 Tax=Nyssa sinensis TaxID=561372 RepID=A0A5J5AN11_9ASTE|nr:hypothetical protein F0562_032438 [Nyssa sinensis]
MPCNSISLTCQDLSENGGSIGNSSCCCSYNLLRSQVRSDESDHHYKGGDSVPLYANKVGPYQNPRYAYDEEVSDNQEETTGWKYIHGDVFRYPKHVSLFTAALGSGTQLFTLTVSILILGIFGVFYPFNRGALLTALVVIYAITSGIAGYTVVSFYCQLEGTNWLRNLLLTGCLFCGPLFLTFCFLNTVSIVYRTTAALPLGTIAVIFLIWLFVASPLLWLGGIAGKNSRSEFQVPCRTTKCPREDSTSALVQGCSSSDGFGGDTAFWCHLH